MSRVIFFSRMALAELYGQLHNELARKFEVYHVAYSEDEKQILEKKYGIKVNKVFKNEVKKRLAYKVSETDLVKLDAYIHKYTDKRFTLNSAIQSDRGFQYLSYVEACTLSYIYFSIWQDVFNEFNADFFVHEATSLMLNHSASIVAKEKNCLYTTELQVEDNAFLMVNYDGSLPVELVDNEKKSSINTVQKNDVEKYIVDYQVRYANLCQDNYKTRTNLLTLLFSSVKNEIKLFLFLTVKSKIVDNIEYYMLMERFSWKKLINCIEYFLFLRYDFFDTDKAYYFYPLHLEPEASVLYWADGYYSGQVKLIENIAAQLPPNVYLYVKDHPHILGYRKIYDYFKLKRIPNIRLLNPQINGKDVIRKSLGVFTLNGTAGFEALLLGKDVFVFGTPYYSMCKNVVRINDIKKIYDLVNGKEQNDSAKKENLDAFVNIYLRSLKKGSTVYYYNNDNAMRNDIHNIKDIANAYEYYFSHYKL